jgi:hypothetical protein
VHIHPGAAQQVARAGEDATLGVFMTAAGAELTDDSITIPGPEGDVTYTEGEDECDGEAAVVQVGYWANATEAADTDPQLFTEDLADINFKNDREAYTIAFLPEGDDLPPPPTIDQLDELAGIDGGDTVTAPSTSAPAPPTTGPGGGSTTTTPAPTTTAPPAG